MSSGKSSESNWRPATVEGDDVADEVDTETIILVQNFQVGEAVSGFESSRNNESVMEISPMIIDVQVNHVASEDASIDTDNTCYITINEKLVKRQNLPMQPLARPRRIQGVNQGMDELITHLSWAKLDMGGYLMQKSYMYVIQNQRQGMILGLKWMEEHPVTVDCDKEVLTFQEYVLQL